MSNITICYYKQDNLLGSDVLLGKEIYDDIEEFLLPINYKNTPFFITKSFLGHANYRWKVKLVLGIKKGVYGVWLIDKDTSTDIYLNQTSMRIKAPFWGVVKKGAIVIVEFGHVYQVANFIGEIKDTYSYPCTHQSGEMHKRRPAIVVSADKHGVKIVPITSKKPDSYPLNKSVFELEEESTQFINEFSNDKNSYVLCEMIQTVSPARILPPNAKSRRNVKTFFRDERYTRIINRRDIWKLETALLSSIGLPKIKQDLLEKEEKLSNLESEKQSLDSDSRLLRQELDKMKLRYKILSELYMPSSNCKSLDEVDSEVDEYIGLD
ncbi:type II toxin-antitoxin system PemK/MazF family toxin [Pectobacterium aroidearum]|uniref:type II toxin-antitoxin system PemK/MazF family toxin n=1 Tax=Pectobacterium aroidearum TaxID=1201031 RepID=UPI001CD6C0AE|nr:type II toxin-antitoxin system PemK/MazF family toxin [Pectobacterium aroidearum]